MQSDIDKESEYGRVHSYIEFILHPELLEAHVRLHQVGSRF